jgi:hypothetical protein
MTEKEVQLLGFEREEYSDEDGDWHYYSYQITDGMSFISSVKSSVSDEIGETKQWYVDIFNTQDPIRFYKFEEVQALLNLLEKHLIK